MTGWAPQQEEQNGDEARAAQSAEEAAQMLASLVTGEKAATLKLCLTVRMMKARSAGGAWRWEWGILPDASGHLEKRVHTSPVHTLATQFCDPLAAMDHLQVG